MRYQTALNPVVSYLLIILVLMPFVKWCPVLPVVFVNCPDTHDRQHNQNISKKSKRIRVFKNPSCKMSHFRPSPLLFLILCNDSFHRLQFQQSWCLLDGPRSNPSKFLLRETQYLSLGDKQKQEQENNNPP